MWVFVMPTWRFARFNEPSSRKATSSPRQSETPLPRRLIRPSTVSKTITSSPHSVMSFEETDLPTQRPDKSPETYLSKNIFLLKKSILTIQHQQRTNERTSPIRRRARSPCWYCPWREHWEPWTGASRVPIKFKEFVNFPVCCFLKVKQSRGHGSVSSRLSEKTTSPEMRKTMCCPRHSEIPLPSTINFPFSKGRKRRNVFAHLVQSPARETLSPSHNPEKLLEMLISFARSIVRNQPRATPTSRNTEFFFQ